LGRKTEIGGGARGGGGREKKDRKRRKGRSMVGVGKRSQERIGAMHMRRREGRIRKEGGWKSEWPNEPTASGKENTVGHSY